MYSDAQQAVLWHLKVLTCSRRQLEKLFGITNAELVILVDDGLIEMHQTWTVGEKKPHRKFIITPRGRETIDKIRFNKMS